MAEEFARERRAYERFQDFLKTAEELSQFFRASGLQLPPALARTLNEHEQHPNLSATRHRNSIVAAAAPARPAGMDLEWISVPIADVTPGLLVLAVLRKADRSMRSKEITDEVRKLQASVNPGSVLNILARLKSTGSVFASGEGVELTDPDFAPSMVEGHAWGPATVFGKYELAAHRRGVIKMLLSAHPGGLQVMQLLNEIHQSGLCKAPASKDLIKADLEAMYAEGLVRRVGNSKKWALAEEKTNGSTINN